MPKAYWISAYQAIHDDAALQAYAKLAGPALQAAGGRALARGVPAAVKEQGRAMRTVVLRVPLTKKLWQRSARTRPCGTSGSLKACEGQSAGQITPLNIITSTLWP